MFAEQKTRKHYTVCASIANPNQSTAFDPNGNHKVDLGDVILYLRALATQQK